jgi:hypothetical protein
MQLAQITAAEYRAFAPYVTERSVKLEDEVITLCRRIPHLTERSAACSNPPHRRRQTSTRISTR